MNQSINTDSKNSKEPQQKYRLGTVSIKILGGLNRFYRRLISPSASIMAQNIQLFGPRGGFLTHQWIIIDELDLQFPLKVEERDSFWPTVSNYRIMWFGNNVTYVTLKSSTYISQILASDIYLLFTQIQLN